MVGLEETLLCYTDECRITEMEACHKIKSSFPYQLIY